MEASWTTSDKIVSAKTTGGIGVNPMNGKGFQAGLPEHNPCPRTERGNRRHASRNDSQQKQAVAAWNKPRTTQLSRYQKAMGMK